MPGEPYDVSLAPFPTAVRETGQGEDLEDGLPIVGACMAQSPRLRH